MVVLEAVVGTDGRVGAVEVLEGLPLGLSEEAVRAAEQWRYEPLLVDGEPVSFVLSLTVRFGLSEP